MHQIKRPLSVLISNTWVLGITLASKKLVQIWVRVLMLGWRILKAFPNAPNSYV